MDTLKNSSDFIKKKYVLILKVQFSEFPLVSLKDERLVDKKFVKDLTI